MSLVHSLVSNFTLDELCILKIELTSGLMNCKGLFSNWLADTKVILLYYTYWQKNVYDFEIVVFNRDKAIFLESFYL